MDSRFDYILFLANKKIDIYIDNNIMNNDIINYWKKFEYKIFSNNKKDKEFVYFYKSRTRNQKLDNITEYVVVPSFDNPRWIIKNNREVIANHGLIIKPTSLKAKFVWWIAKQLNSFSLFNLVFNSRIILNNIEMEDNFGLNDDLKAGIIYTGAIGKFQKFTVQLMDQKNNTKLYFKLATKQDGIERIKNEVNALRYLNQQEFDCIEIPKLEKIVETEDYYGMIQNDILENSDMSLSFQKLDIDALDELYNISKCKEIILGDYLATLFKSHKSSLLLKYNDFIQEMKNEKLVLSISHGDYIPWNRFIKDSKVKIIDWEMYKYRPLFYDMYFYLIHKAVLIDNMEIVDINTVMLNEIDKTNIIKINSMMNDKTKLIYIFMISIELYVHYEKNNEKHDKKMLLVLRKNLILLKQKIEKLNGKYI